LQQLQAEVTDLKIERERLAKEVLRFRNDPKAMEELIHRELGYVYPDEYMGIMPSESGVKSQESGVRGQKQ